MVWMTSQGNCENKSDEEIVKLSLGDSQYFYCLMKRYEEKLARYVGRLTGIREEDVDDVVQETFIKAYRHLNDCDCDLRFSSWIYRIAHNEAVNFLKKHHLGQKIIIDDTEGGIGDWLTDGADVEKEAVDSHFKDYMRDVLERIKPEYKEVLMLKFMEGRDYQDISDILQKPIGTVATLIRRAKIQFKYIYEKDKKYQR